MTKLFRLLKQSLTVNIIDSTGLEMELHLLVENAVNKVKNVASCNEFSS